MLPKIAKAALAHRAPKQGPLATPHHSFASALNLAAPTRPRPQTQAHAQTHTQTHAQTHAQTQTHAHTQAHVRRAPDERPPSDDAPLDPLARALAPPPLPLPVVPQTAPASSSSAATTQTLAPELLDQAAFWGDGSRGVARLRFGARAKGGLSGATVTLEHDGDNIALRVEGDAELASTLRERLARRGLAVEED